MPNVAKPVVNVVRTRNSVYAVVVYVNRVGDTARLGQVTCLEGTFAGQSYAFDRVNSQPITVGAPMHLRLVTPEKEGWLGSSVVERIDTSDPWVTSPIH